MNFMPSIRKADAPVQESSANVPNAASLEHNKAHEYPSMESRRVPEYVESATCRYHPAWKSALYCCQKDGCGGARVSGAFCYTGEFFNNHECKIPAISANDRKFPVPPGLSMPSRFYNTHWKWTGPESDAERPRKMSDFKMQPEMERKMEFKMR